MNNRLEQDHRAIKQRYYPMRGFGSFDAAARFCTAHDELRDHFRNRRQLNERSRSPSSGGCSLSVGVPCGLNCGLVRRHQSASGAG